MRFCRHLYLIEEIILRRFKLNVLLNELLLCVDIKFLLYPEFHS